MERLYTNRSRFNTEFGCVFVAELTLGIAIGVAALVLISVSVHCSVCIHRCRKRRRSHIFTALILHSDGTVYAHKVVRKFLIKLTNVKFVSLAVVFRFRRCLSFVNAFHLHSCNVQLLLHFCAKFHYVGIVSFFFFCFLLSVLELQFMRIRMYISLFA